MYHRHGIYKMELVYVQTRVKGPGSPELALEWKNEDWNYANFMHLVQTYTIVFMNDFGLNRYKICWR